MSSLAPAAPLLSLQPLRIKFPILLSSQRLSLLNLGILLYSRLSPFPPVTTTVNLTQTSRSRVPQGYFRCFTGFGVTDGGISLKPCLQWLYTALWGLPLTSHFPVSLLAQGCVSLSAHQTSFSSAFAFPLDRSQEFKLALGLQLLCISNSDKSQAAVHKADSVLIPRKAAALLSGLSAATQFGNSAHTRKSSSISQVTGLRASAEITVSWQCPISCSQQWAERFLWGEKSAQFCWITLKNMIQHTQIT